MSSSLLRVRCARAAAAAVGRLCVAAIVSTRQTMTWALGAKRTYELQEQVVQDPAIVQGDIE